MKVHVRSHKKTYFLTAAAAVLLLAACSGSSGDSSSDSDLPDLLSKNAALTGCVVPEVTDATGVTAEETEDGDCVVQFTNVGNNTMTVPAGVSEIEYLVVAGGGGGSSGGGGGGGVLTNFGATALAVTSGDVIEVAVGAGGNFGGGGSAGSNKLATSGQNSRLGDITAIGGGRGGGNAGMLPLTGGSSGGGGYDQPNIKVPAGTEGQGFKGGKSDRGSYGAAGGGGGAGANGGDVRGMHIAGHGGDGIASLITGTEKYFGGGGGGGVNSNCNCEHPGDPGGNGGLGGGGKGSSLGYRVGDYFNGTNGEPNTGGGGGGTDPESTLAGNGGSGIVIVRFATTPVGSASAEESTTSSVEETTTTVEATTTTVEATTTTVADSGESLARSTDINETVSNGLSGAPESQVVEVPSDAASVPCADTCLNDLRSSLGITAGDVYVSVDGGEKVLLDGTTEIPVGISGLSLTFSSAEGGKEVTVPVYRNAEVLNPVEESTETTVATTSTEDSGSEDDSSFPIIWIIIAVVVIAGVVTVVVRRKK